MSLPPDAFGPLAGLRILDLTCLLPGSVATLHFAEVGDDGTAILREVGYEESEIAASRAAGTI
jgi:hypothetical protein